MSTPQVIRYPLDPTGKNPNNLVVNEPQTMINRQIRVIAPTYGAFFANSMVITDVATGKALTSSQYYNCEMYELPTERYGQEIDAMICITDPTVSSNVTLTYQALGGEYSSAVDVIVDQIYALNLDDRPVAWPSIIDRPDKYPPSYHLHDIGDIYGFEYLVHAVDRIRTAIEMGDQASHDQIYAYIDSANQQNAANLAALQAALNAHENNFNNPHQVTPAQLNVYTKPQSDAITTPINTNLNNHIANKSNPHGVTAAQLGVYTTAQTYSSGQVDSAINTAVTNLQNQINTNATTMNNHINNRSNPHGVTPGQIGTYDAATINSLIANNKGGKFGAWQGGAISGTASSDGIFVVTGGDNSNVYVYVNGSQIYWDAARDKYGSGANASSFPIAAGQTWSIGVGSNGNRNNPQAIWFLPKS